MEIGAEFKCGMISSITGGRHRRHLVVPLTESGAGSSSMRTKSEMIWRSELRA